MSYGFKAELWGDYALFTRPEMKVERASYDCITPSAVRGILEAVFWHPGVHYFVDKIYVLNEIKFANIRRNEVNFKISARNAKKVWQDGAGELLYGVTTEGIAQRAALVLKDVHYVVAAHFELEGEINTPQNETKYSEILKRRLQKGQCYHMPYFGCREFPVNFGLYEDATIKTAYEGERDLGFMLYDMDYSDPKNITPVFFRAVLRDGMLNVQKAKEEVYR